jgi:hypothetical protein
MFRVLCFKHFGLIKEQLSLPDMYKNTSELIRVHIVKLCKIFAIHVFKKEKT